MKRIAELIGKRHKLVVGLLSGTSADGIDAVLARVSGWGLQTSTETLAFCTVPYSERMREAVLNLASGSGNVADLCRMNFVLGERFADAALRVLREAGIDKSALDLVGTTLDFVDSLWSNRGAFHGHWADDDLDVEYCFYALLALGHLSV